MIDERRCLTRSQVTGSSVNRAVVDRVYPTSEVVEAHRYVEPWRKAGNVVLTIP